MISSDRQAESPSSRSDFGGIVVAAGAGTRLGHPSPKALTQLAGRPLVAYAVDVLGEAQASEIVVVHPPGMREDFAAAMPEANSTKLVEGGATRTQSVRAGLAALAAGPDIVAVHDAARPLTPISVVRSVLRAMADDVVAAAPSLPVSDTLKRLERLEVVATIDRSDLVAVQTPQVFRRLILQSVLSEESAEATDELALVEMQLAAGRIAGRIALVSGSVFGHKVTFPDDLALLESAAAYLSKGLR